MLHRLRPTPARFASAVLAAGALLTACSPNPADWVEARWEPLAVLTQRCPNLEGTFALRSGNRSPLSQTVFASYVRSSAPRFPWETVTLAGDANDSLVLTVARSQQQREAYRDAVFQRGEYYEREYRRMHSPSVRWSSGFATMTDSAYGANLETLYLAPVRSYTLRRGEHYTCKGGWLRVDRIVHDPGPDRNNPRPDTVVGEVLLRKGWKGDLVAMAKVREAREFTVWCGDGCKGIPLGTWTARTWGRWRSSAVASDGPSPRPWAEPFEAAPVAASDPAPDTPPEEIARELRPMLPAGLQLQSVSRDGVGYRALLAGRSTTPFTQLVSTLRRSYRFRHERVVGLSRLAHGEWVLALSLGDIWRDSPANPRDPTGPLVRALPDGVRMVGVRGAGKGLEVTLVSQEQPPMDDAVRAIARLSAYDSVAVKSSIRSTYDQAIVAIVYVRERAEP
ncbi:MAG: hypothetical protein IPF87_01430 [Gemmatimonadetes bacterium]|nr:hypothetical protein [Gemmatimonadota bacterium]